MARTPIPIPENLALTLAAHVAQFPGEWLLTNDWCHQLGPCETYLAGSGSTTCATTTPAFSSPAVWT
jgi:hypothetical protein